jgi:membrane protease YdiL (CAAX protease family)
MAVVVEGGLVLLAIGLGWLFDHGPLEHFHLDWSSAGLGAVATLPMLLAFLIMVRWPIGPLRAIKKFTDTIIRPLMETCTIVDLFGISLLAGVGEEMLFRGLMQDLFAHWVSFSWLAVLLASVLFGTMHAVTPAYAALATLIGIYLGAVYLWTENLLAPIIAHGLYDFVVLVYLVYTPGPTEPASGEDTEVSVKSEDSSTPAPPSSL